MKPNERVNPDEFEKEVLTFSLENIKQNSTCLKIHGKEFMLLSIEDYKWLIEKLEATIEELNRCTHCEVLGVSNCGCLDKAREFLEGLEK